AGPTLASTVTGTNQPPVTKIAAITSATRKRHVRLTARTSSRESTQFAEEECRWKPRHHFVNVCLVLGFDLQLIRDDRREHEEDCQQKEQPEPVDQGRRRMHIGQRLGAMDAGRDISVKRSE